MPVAGDRLGHLDFSPDGHTLAVAVGSRVNLLRDADKRAERQTLEGHLLPVTALTFAPDGGTLATASADSMVRTWADAATGKATRPRRARRYRQRPVFRARTAKRSRPLASHAKLGRLGAGMGLGDGAATKRPSPAGAAGPPNRLASVRTASCWPRQLEPRLSRQGRRLWPRSTRPRPTLFTAGPGPDNVGDLSTDARHLWFELGRQDAGNSGAGGRVELLGSSELPAAGNGGEF